MCEKKAYCSREIDECIRELVAKINQDPNLKTLSSCCGHGVYFATIVVKKSNGFIFEWFSLKELNRRKRNRYYTKDENGYYFIPEVIVRMPNPNPKCVDCGSENFYNWYNHFWYCANPDCPTKKSTKDLMIDLASGV